MGCASSAPMVQGGLDGAKQKAKGIAADASNFKDEAIGKMKEAGETVKEKAIEVKDDIEEKMSSLVHSGKTSAEEAAEKAKAEAEEAAEEARKAKEEASEAAEKAAEEVKQVKEEAVKEINDTVAEVKQASQTSVEELKSETTKQDFEPRGDKILFIDVDEDSVVIHEMVIGGVDFSSRASTAAPHSPEIWTRPSETPEKFPASELEDIKHEIEEDLKGMEEDINEKDDVEENCKLQEIETEQQKYLDLHETEHDIKEKMINEINDEEAVKIMEETNEIINEDKMHINVGDDIEREAEELKKEEMQPISDTNPDQEHEKEENNNINKNHEDKTDEKNIIEDV